MQLPVGKRQRNRCRRDATGKARQCRMEGSIDGVDRGIRAGPPGEPPSLADRRLHQDLIRIGRCGNAADGC